MFYAIPSLLDIYTIDAHYRFIFNSATSTSFKVCSSSAISLCNTCLLLLTQILVSLIAYLESVSLISRNNWIKRNSIKVLYIQNACYLCSLLNTLFNYLPIIYLLINSIAVLRLYFDFGIVQYGFVICTAASNRSLPRLLKGHWERKIFQQLIRVSILLPRLLLIKFYQTLKRFVFEIYCEIPHYYAAPVFSVCFYYITYAFRLNLHSVIAWMSRNSLLETGVISDK